MTAEVRRAPGAVLRQIGGGTRIYLRIARQYRRAFLFQLIIYPVQLLFAWQLWHAAMHSGLLRSQSLFDTSTILLYYAFTYLMMKLMETGRLATQVADDIHTGRLVVYQARPVEYWQILASQHLSRLIINASLCLPIVLSLLAVYHGALHLTAGSVVGFVLTAVLAVLLESVLYFCIGIAGFWVDKIWGLLLMAQFLISLLAGRLLPLSFFPDSFLTYANALPFRWMSYEPIRLLLTQPAPGTVVTGLLIQLVWLAIFIAGAAALWRKGLTKFSGHGT